MPKVTRRSQRLAAANAATTATNTTGIHNRTQVATEHNSISIECEKFIVVYEHHQDQNRSRHTRLHISKRGELGPPRVPNNQQQQHGQIRSLLTTIAVV